MNIATALLALICFLQFSQIDEGVRTEASQFSNLVGEDDDAEDNNEDPWTDMTSANTSTVFNFNAFADVSVSSKSRTGVGRGAHLTKPSWAT
jgi:hypothetical protein